MSDIPLSVRTWAARPGAAALLAVARRKVETGRSGDRTPLQVEGEHRADVGRLLGVPWEVSGKTATLRVLREALSRSGTTLDEILVATGGPLRNAAAEKADATAETAARRERIAATLTGSEITEPVARAAWRWMGPADRAEEVAGQVARAWAALPVRPGLTVDQPGGIRSVRLAAFAGQVLADPHALDRDRAAGRALARIIAASAHAAGSLGNSDADLDDTSCDTRAGRDATASPEPAGASDATGGTLSVLSARTWREVWSSVGVQCDQVSSTVLMLNLPLTGPVEALGTLTAIPGEPVWVTSRMTTPGCAAQVPVSGMRPLVVRVCENPAVIEAAADQLGAHCGPVVCLYGRPSGAAWDVLAAVAAAGGRLLVSADRDAAGSQILAEVKDAFPEVVEEWVPDVEGLYEEQRLSALLDDVRFVR